MYRTIDREGKTLEIWDKREQVSPTLDYHKIQLVTPIAFAIRESYDSLYDMNDIPF
jgi:hypothetical protein